MPAVLTASTSRGRSCWPLSGSPGSSPVTLTPVPVSVRPTSTIRRNDGHSLILGPTIATSSRRSASSRSAARVPRSTAESSCSNQIHSEVGAAASPSRTASPKPVPEGAYVTRSAPNDSCSKSPLPSMELTSTACQAVGAYSMEPSEERTLGSHAPPLWATRIAVTVGGSDSQRRASSASSNMRSSVLYARFLSLRRSRSDRPPQMPKRSSFASA